MLRLLVQKLLCCGQCRRLQFFEELRHGESVLGELNDREEYICFHNTCISSDSSNSHSSIAVHAESLWWPGEDIIRLVVLHHPTDRKHGLSDRGFSSLLLILKFIIFEFLQVRNSAHCNINLMLRIGYFVCGWSRYRSSTCAQSGKLTPCINTMYIVCVHP